MKNPDKKKVTKGLIVFRRLLKEMRCGSDGRKIPGLQWAVSSQVDKADFLLEGRNQREKAKPTIAVEPAN